MCLSEKYFWAVQVECFPGPLKSVCIQCIFKRSITCNKLGNGYTMNQLISHQ